MKTESNLRRPIVAGDFVYFEQSSVVLGKRKWAMIPGYVYSVSDSACAAWVDYWDFDKQEVEQKLCHLDTIILDEDFNKPSKVEYELTLLRF